MAGGQKISRAQERAIVGLLCEGSIEAAAARAKISPRTLAYWLKTPAFSLAYREARREVVEHAVGVLQKASLSAVLALLRNLNCGRPASEIAAANSLLEKSLQAVEQFDVLSRLEALEAQAALKGTNHHATSNGQAANNEARGPAGR
jgi:hypothetical protein